MLYSFVFLRAGVEPRPYDFSFLVWYEFIRTAECINAFPTLFFAIPLVGEGFHALPLRTVGDAGPYNVLSVCVKCDILEQQWNNVVKTIPKECLELFCTAYCCTVVCKLANTNIVCALSVNNSLFFVNCK